VEKVAGVASALAVQAWRRLMEPASVTAQQEVCFLPDFAVAVSHCPQTLTDLLSRSTCMPRIPFDNGFSCSERTSFSVRFR